MSDECNSCCKSNCKNPNAPEYNKCFKPENNSGCSCSCSAKKANEDNGGIEEATTTIVRFKNTREDFI